MLQGEAIGARAVAEGVAAGRWAGPWGVGLRPGHGLRAGAAMRTERPAAEGGSRVR